MPDAILERRREALLALQRDQIVDGFAAAATEKGYAAATIADIVRIAHVSKSTFYEHFTDKEAVYVVLHRTVADALEIALNASRQRTAGHPDWTARVRDLVRTCLGVVASSPAYLAQAVVEPQIATATALRLRDDAARRNARIWIGLSKEIAQTTPAVAPIEEHVAFAGMAAGVMFINAAASGGPDAVRALEDPLTDVWVRLFHAP
jgi:AcrR family transcriptional regulator